MFVIDDATSNDVLFPDGYGRGCVERDYSVQPMPMQAVEFPLIPRSEWSARIKEKEQTKSRISDVRRRCGPNGGLMPSLDQGPVGYCWAHSTVHGAMLLRGLQGQAYVPLSAYAVAATIKGGRDEGAWGALSMDFAISRGIPSQSFWPQGSRDLSKGTAACWENAKLHRVTENWMDLARQAWDRELSFDQVITLLLSDIPVVGDFNWWGHSVILMDAVEVEPGSFGVRILNSWSDGWGDKGEAVLRGSQAIPDGACAPRSVAVGG